jgi:tellurite resistance protein TerC
MHDDFNPGAQPSTGPKAIQKTKRLLKIVLGFTLLVMGTAMLVLPGPGWLTIGLGLVVLAAEFLWARRVLQRFNEQAIKLGISVFEKSDSRGSLDSR